MTTVDKLLNQILNDSEVIAQKQLTQKDFDLLTSLNKILNSERYVTANQGYLIVRTLKENCRNLPTFTDQILQACETPIWNHRFRQLEVIKKLKIEKYSDDELVLCLESSHSTELRNLIISICKEIDQLTGSSNPKAHYFPLTEQNIVYLVEKLTPHKFDIDENIKKHYETIKSWKFEEVKNQFLLTTIENSNFHKAITSDLGLTTAIDQNIIADRSVRYNYFLENPKNFSESLTEVIANRSSSKVFVDKSEHTLSEVISSIRDLKRFPILVVFEQSEEKKSFENLEILSKSLEENGIFDKVGIYFRMPNSDDGKKFNNMIAEKKYNAYLDVDSKVVAVQSGKIPKFFLKNAWKPMTVIALDTKMGLRHGKTSVYSNRCDLIIEYSDKPSILEERRIIPWR